MGKSKKPKCVLILTEGPSDRAALTGFFTDLYSMIDEDIEVFFPVLQEEMIDESDKKVINYNGDITSRNGITPDNILGLLLKMFIQPELKKHPAYRYPSSVNEVIHIIDVDGVYLDDECFVECGNASDYDTPFYDEKNKQVIVSNVESIIKRNNHKRNNIDRLVNTKRLEISMSEESNDIKEKPYRVFYFSSNLDHVLYGNPNNVKNNKVQDARRFSNDFYDESLKLAHFFINHPYKVETDDYIDSWDILKTNTYNFAPKTNLNILVEDLLRRANISKDEIPRNDIRAYFKEDT